MIRYMGPTTGTTIMAESSAATATLMLLATEAGQLNAQDH